MDVCPVCGGRHIKPVMRKAVVNVEGEQPITGILAFTCAKGHLIVVAETDEGTTTRVTDALLNTPIR